MKFFPRLLIAFLSVSLVPLVIVLLGGSGLSPYALRLTAVIGLAAVVASVILAFSFAQPIEKLFLSIENFLSKKGYPVKWSGGFPQAAKRYRELISSADVTGQAPVNDAGLTTVSDLPAGESGGGNQGRLASILGKDGANPLAAGGGEQTLVKQMANILGHEIRNPLGAMSGAIFLLKRHLANHPEAAAVTAKATMVIENEIKSIAKIIDNLLDYSRTRPPVLADKDMSDVVREIAENLKPPETVQLSLALEGSYMARIDVDEVKQVVRNLANNAIDAMGEKGGELKFSVFRSVIARQGGDAPAVCLNVMDTGCGIEPEKLKKIFEPFFSTKSKGMGLGLAVVKKIIEERHKGSVEVASTPGQGTTFSVKFPLLS